MNTDDGFQYPMGVTQAEASPSPELLGSFDILCQIHGEYGSISWYHDFAVPPWEVGQLFGGN